MRRRQFLEGWATAALLTMSGCSTTSSVGTERGTGLIFSYAASFDEVWAALPELLKDLGMRVTGQNVEAGLMTISTGGGYSWGDSGEIFVERIGTQGNCRVEVIPKKTLGIDLTLNDWPKDVHNRLGQRFKRY